MARLYEYLQRNVRRHDIATLSQLKIICDVDNRQMLQPENVVIDLRPHESIKGHIEKAPDHFGRYFDLFEWLGAAKNVTANHYATVLLWKKKQSKNEKLDVEELKVVRTAVEGLFRCLREGTEEQKKMTVKALYLPTEGKSLQKSTEVIFQDGYHGDKFHNPPEGKYFFLGFENLKIEVTLPQNDIRRLPTQYSVVLLSEIVHEIIPDEILRTAEEADQSNPIVRTLMHPVVTQGIIRLVCYQYECSKKRFTEETVEQVVQTLKYVSVIEVTKLKTIKTMYSKPVLDTECKKPSFTVKTEGDSRVATVYIAKKAVNRWSKYKERFIRSLALALQFVLRMELETYLLHCVLQKPAKAMVILNQENIPQCAFTSALDDVVFPSPGDFVSLQFHHHLNNSFFDFYKGEHVGYEVYDPDLDDDGSSDAEGNGSDCDPVYIYGIILDEVCHQNAENDNRLTRHYLVDLGPDHGRIKVSVVKLYKFVRPSKEGLLMVMGQHQKESNTEPEKPLELKVALAEIRSLFTEAWQLPDQKDRKHVVKRLLLQWHPDKNLGNEEFCTLITQTILHYLKLMEQGQRLPSDDDEGHSYAADSEEFFRSSSSFSSYFFAKMDARGIRHRHFFDLEVNRRGRSRSRGYRSSGRYDCGANSQPGESHRWLRQAQTDIRAAQASIGSSQRGHNWVCYQCHQAVEKSLKAVLFQRDADSFDIESHDLPSLAKRVADGQGSTLVDLVQQLEARVGPPARMRYPDVLVYPRIPAEVYTEEDVTFAFDIASRVLDYVQSLMRVATELTGVSAVPTSLSPQQTTMRSCEPIMQV